MEETSNKIIVSEESIPKLHNSPAFKGQEWCAYTFLLIPNPQTDNYGICKVLCFGSTQQAVEKLVYEMLDDGRIEAGIPFIRVCPTGMYRYLKAGGDDRDLKESYDLNTKTSVIESSKLIAEKRKKEMREMQERMNDLKEEAKEERKQDPDSYEAYVFHRNQLDMSRQREKQLSSEVELLKKIMSKASKEAKRIESQHGNFKLKYSTQFQKPVDTEEKGKEETQ